LEAGKECLVDFEWRLFKIPLLTTIVEGKEDQQLISKLSEFDKKDSGM
jgi:hypothetical protein